MSDDDMLVYPDEFKMGMKEEGKEHSDITGGDKEAVKKIVLAHLKEDPHYYTKLGTVMKAEEETERLTPHYKPSGPQKPTGYKMSPKEEVETQIHLNPKKAEEEYDPSKGGRILAPVKKSAEEVPKVPRTIPGTKAPKTRSYLESQGLLTKNKAEEDEFTPHSKTPGKVTAPKMPEFKAPKGPAPKSESDLPSERFGSEEKLSSKLIKKAEEELGKDKVDEMKNKTVIEEFVKEEKAKAEEKAKPPAFHAEPK